MQDRCQDVIIVCRHARLSADPGRGPSPFCAASSLPCRARRSCLPGPAKLVKIEAQPASITLNTPFQYSQLLLTGVLDSGERTGRHALAQIERPAKVVSISASGLVRPVADGDGALKHQLRRPDGGRAGQSERPEGEYRGQLRPRRHAACSRSWAATPAPATARQKARTASSCRCAATIPLFDHRALTDDLDGRRFNRAAPDTSLMLLKPSGGVPHVGGVLTQPGEPYYELLRSWIADGVKLDLNSPRVAKLEVLPQSAVIPLPGMKQQMAVLATYTDGSVRDVTAEAFLESSNTEVATVDQAAALVTAVRRGETAVLARYEGAYAAATLIVMGDRSGFAWKDVAEIQLDRHARLREAQAGQGAAERRLHRRRFHPPASIST